MLKVVYDKRLILFFIILVLVSLAHLLLEIHKKFHFDHGLVFYIFPIFKHSIVILFLLLNSPPKNLIVNSRVAWGIILSFLAPIFINSDVHIVANVALPLVLAAFFFYAIVLLISLFTLGSSFGVLPAVRDIKLNWPYNSILHPMYGSYLHLFSLTAALSPGYFNFALVIICYVGLYLRAMEEEDVLKSDKNYEKLVQSVRMRFFSISFSMPAIIAVCAFLSSKYFVQNNTAEVRLVFPYPILTLNPLQYDEWHSIFIGNHIYRRLSDDIERSIPGVTQGLNYKCIDPGRGGLISTDCKNIQILFNFRKFKNCEDMWVSKDQLLSEFVATIKKVNWIFPNFKMCSNAGFDACLAGPNFKDMQRRLQSLYLRFGWSGNDDKLIIGVGPYCLKNIKENKRGLITFGELIPHPDYAYLPHMIFDVTNNKHTDFDIALFGFSRSVSHKEISSHTPLGYYLVTNPKYESDCEPWEDDAVLNLIMQNLKNSNLTYNDKNLFKTLLPVGGEKKCNKDAIYLKMQTNKTKSISKTLLLPSFIADCDSLAIQINDYWRSLNLARSVTAKCGDTTELIMNQVVVNGENWDAFLTPLSPGYPGRDAIQVQYFTRDSITSWISKSRIPTKNFILLGVGQANMTLKANRFCDVKPSALGLGDLFITDLLGCD